MKNLGGLRNKLLPAIYATNITEAIAIEERVLLPREMNLISLIIKGLFGYNLFLLKLKIENTVTK